MNQGIRKNLTSCVESEGGEGDISSSIIVDGEMVDPGDDVEREDKKYKEVEHPGTKHEYLSPASARGFIVFSA